MTKRFLFSLLVLCVAVSGASAKFLAASVDLNGKWNVTVSLPDQGLPIALELTQTDQTFTGKMSSAMGDGTVTNGTIKENEFSAVIQATIQGQAMDVQLNGKYEADKITGTLTIPNADPFPFEGTKAKE